MNKVIEVYSGLNSNKAESLRGYLVIVSNDINNFKDSAYINDIKNIHPLLGFRKRSPSSFVCRKDGTGTGDDVITFRVGQDEKEQQEFGYIANFEVIDEKQNKTDAIYSERNLLAIAFCKMALKLGWNAGKANPLSLGEWPLVYVDLPDGNQISWHIAETEQWALEGLPNYNRQWNGKYYGRDPKWIDSIDYSQFKIVGVDFADENKDSTVTLIRKLKPVDDSCLNKVVMAYDGDGCCIKGHYLGRTKGGGFSIWDKELQEITEYFYVNRIPEVKYGNGGNFE